jgi:leucyl-tRNA synthetase
MPQWAGSCWYYLRFLDPKNDKVLVDAEIEKAWMPVDLYVGGAEHAVLHLLYARFWHKVLFDYGYVSTAEPFQKLVNQGMILGEMEFTVDSAKVDADAVEKRGDTFVLKSDPKIKVDSRAHKMSKSRGNVVNPDEVVAEYGADSLRLYEMFMGPLEVVKPWSMDGVNGVRGFLDRVWRMIVDESAEKVTLNSAVKDVEPTEEQDRMLHKTIKAVSHDVAGMEFNTAISRMMEFTNFFLKQDVRPISAMEKLVLMLSPYAPHICEELWQLLGHADTLSFEPWPEYNEAALVEDTVEIPVQVMGKLRARVTVPTGADRETLEAAARAHLKIAEILGGKTVRKVVVVPGRMVNFVVK